MYRIENAVEYICMFKPHASFYIINLQLCLKIILPLFRATDLIGLIYDL